MEAKLIPSSPVKRRGARWWKPAEEVVYLDQPVVLLCTEHTMEDELARRPPANILLFAVEVGTPASTATALLSPGRPVTSSTGWSMQAELQVGYRTRSVVHSATLNSTVQVMTGETEDSWLLTTPPKSYPRLHLLWSSFIPAVRTLLSDVLLDRNCVEPTGDDAITEEKLLSLLQSRPYLLLPLPHAVLMCCRPQRKPQALASTQLLVDWRSHCIMQRDGDRKPRKLAASTPFRTMLRSFLVDNGAFSARISSTSLAFASSARSASSHKLDAVRALSSDDPLPALLEIERSLQGGSGKGRQSAQQDWMAAALLPQLVRMQLQPKRSHRLLQAACSVTQLLCMRNVDVSGRLLKLLWERDAIASRTPSSDGYLRTMRFLLRLLSSDWLAAFCLRAGLFDRLHAQLGRLLQPAAAAGDEDDRSYASTASMRSLMSAADFVPLPEDGRGGDGGAGEHRRSRLSLFTRSSSYERMSTAPPSPVAEERGGRDGGGEDDDAAAAAAATAADTATKPAPLVSTVPTAAPTPSTAAALPVPKLRLHKLPDSPEPVRGDELLSTLSFTYTPAVAADTPRRELTPSQRLKQLASSLGEAAMARDLWAIRQQSTGAAAAAAPSTAARPAAPGKKEEEDADADEEEEEEAAADEEVENVPAVAFVVLQCMRRLTAVALPSQLTWLVSPANLLFTQLVTSIAELGPAGQPHLRRSILALLRCFAYEPTAQASGRIDTLVWRVFNALDAGLREAKRLKAAVRKSRSTTDSGQLKLEWRFSIERQAVLLRVLWLHLRSAGTGPRSSHSLPFCLPLLTSVLEEALSIVSRLIRSRSFAVSADVLPPNANLLDALLLVLDELILSSDARPYAWRLLALLLNDTTLRPLRQYTKQLLFSRRSSPVLLQYRLHAVRHFRACLRLVASLADSRQPGSAEQAAVWLHRLDFLFRPEHGYALRYLRNQEAQEADSQLSAVGIETLRLLIDCFSLPGCPYLRMPDFVQRYVSFHTVCFLKLYCAPTRSPAALQHSRLHLSMLLCFARSPTTDSAACFRQSRLMPFLVRELAQEHSDAAVPEGKRASASAAPPPRPRILAAPPVLAVPAPLGAASPIARSPDGRQRLPPLIPLGESAAKAAGPLAPPAAGSRAPPPLAPAASVAAAAARRRSLQGGRALPAPAPLSRLEKKKSSSDVDSCDAPSTVREVRSIMDEPLGSDDELSWDSDDFAPPVIGKSSAPAKMALSLTSKTAASTPAPSKMDPPVRSIMDEPLGSDDELSWDSDDFAPPVIGKSSAPGKMALSLTSKTAASSPAPSKLDPPVRSIMDEPLGSDDELSWDSDDFAPPVIGKSSAAARASLHLGKSKASGDSAAAADDAAGSVSRSEGAAGADKRDPPVRSIMDEPLGSDDELSWDSDDFAPPVIGKSSAAARASLQLGKSKASGDSAGGSAAEGDQGGRFARIPTKMVRPLAGSVAAAVMATKDDAPAKLASTPAVARSYQPPKRPRHVPDAVAKVRKQLRPVAAAAEPADETDATPAPPGSKLLASPALHVEALTLVLALSVAPSGGQLDPAYYSPTPLEDGLELNIAFLLRQHLAGEACRQLLPALYARAQATSRGALRLLRLLCAALFETALYRTRGHLGSGAFGVVYDCDMPLAPGHVAVKSLELPSSMFARVRLPSLFTEVSLMEELRPLQSVVQLLDYGLTRDGYWLVMERCDGNLLDWRQAQGELSESMLPLLLSIFLHVCRAVVELHAHGGVHYDIKCENVLLRGQPGEPQFSLALADFGESYFAPVLPSAEAVSITGAARGTEAVMSPELLRGQASGPSSDVWSLGCLLYQLLTGNYLFSTTVWTEFFVRLTTEGRPLLVEEQTAALGDSGAVVADLLNSMLVRDSSRRPRLREVCVRVQGLCKALGKLGGDLRPESLRPAAPPRRTEALQVEDAMRGHSRLRSESRSHWTWVCGPIIVGKPHGSPARLHRHAIDVIVRWGGATSLAAADRVAGVRHIIVHESLPFADVLIDLLPRLWDAMLRGARVLIDGSNNSAAHVALAWLTRVHSLPSTQAVLLLRELLPWAALSAVKLEAVLACTVAVPPPLARQSEAVVLFRCPCGAARLGLLSPLDSRHSENPLPCACEEGGERSDCPSSLPCASLLRGMRLCGPHGSLQRLLWGFTDGDALCLPGGKRGCFRSAHTDGAAADGSSWQLNLCALCSSPVYAAHADGRVAVVTNFTTDMPPLSTLPPPCRQRLPLLAVAEIDEQQEEERAEGEGSVAMEDADAS